jgi:hemoglobin-like flavoprotein
MSPNPKQIQNVRSTMPALSVYGNEVMAHFYKTLFDQIPELHDTFNNGNRANNLTAVPCMLHAIL